jgi:hypothetical protein
LSKTARKVPSVSGAAELGQEGEDIAQCSYVEPGLEVSPSDTKGKVTTRHMIYDMNVLSETYTEIDDPLFLDAGSPSPLRLLADTALDILGFPQTPEPEGIISARGNSPLTMDCDEASITEQERGVMEDVQATSVVVDPPAVAQMQAHAPQVDEMAATLHPTQSETTIQVTAAITGAPDTTIQPEAVGPSSLKRTDSEFFSIPMKRAREVTLPEGYGGFPPAKRSRFNAWKENPFVLS